MVNFINTEGGREIRHSIQDYDLNKLESDFKGAVDHCLDKKDPPAFLTVDSLYCVGSYARKDATRDSDLDLVAEFSGSKMNVRNDISKTVVANCMMENPELFLQDSMRTPATEADVLPAFNDGIWLLLEQFYNDSRTGEVFTGKAVYDITDREYLDRKTVKERAKNLRELDERQREI